MSGQVSKPHPLKDKWYVTYFPFIRRKAKSEKFQLQQNPNELDWVTTAEELYSTVNSFPHYSLLPVGDSLVFARNKTDPYFENFASGGRIGIYTQMQGQGDRAITMVLASVMGEHLRTLTNGEPVADVVRITHKDSKYEYALHVDVWLRTTENSDKLVNYFEGLIGKANGISVNFRPFDGDATRA